MNDLDALDRLLTRRHSCRAFLSDPIPEDVIAQIVATAQKVPSWCNAQPWQVTVTSGAETDRLRYALFAKATSAAAQPDIPFPTRYDGVYKSRRSTCGWALYEAVGVEKGDRAGSARQMMENFRFFGAPHLALITSPRVLGAYGALDVGGFVTTFCLAAEAMGLMRMTSAEFHADVKEKRLAAMGIDPADIEKLIEDRGKARADKDWGRADEIRDELEAKSILVMDSTDGVQWRVKL